MYLPLRIAILILAAPLLLTACGTVPPATSSAPDAAPGRPVTTASHSSHLPLPAVRLPAPPVVEPPPHDPDSNIFFTSGSDQINIGARQQLQSVAEKLKGKVRADVMLIGHTDDAGSTEFNIALAQKRVEAVAAELQSRGVSSRQIRRISYGNEASGAYSCATARCRQNERRVELRLSLPD